MLDSLHRAGDQSKQSIIAEESPSVVKQQ